MGTIFIVVGGLFTALGLLSMSSDIQLGIAVGGLNLIGIGLILNKMAVKAAEDNKTT
jgi:hypothetical protein